MPTSTISLIPPFARASISFFNVSSGLERTLPLDFGIMQYEQNLSHPSSIFTNALILSWKRSIEQSQNSSPVLCCSIFTSLFLLRLYSFISESISPSFLFEKTISASMSSLASSGKACGIHPVNITVELGWFLLNFLILFLVFWSAVAVTVQEFTM